MGLSGCDIVLRENRELQVQRSQNFCCFKRPVDEKNRTDVAVKLVKFEKKEREVYSEELNFQAGFSISDHMMAKNLQGAVIRYKKGPDIRDRKGPFIRYI